MGVVRSARGRWIVTALLVGSFLAVGFAPPRLAADAAERAETAAAPNALPEVRDDFLALTNADRAAYDRQTVALAERLSRYATRHSRRMANLGSIFHSGDEQLRDALAGTDWSTAGENVGVGESIESVQDAFMLSAPHRRNILDGSYDHAAIGVVEADGVVWITVIFYGD